MPDAPVPGWTDSDSETFLDIADVAVPGRREQLDVLVSLVPANDDAAFLAADLACGEGLISERLLDRFANSRVRALDGSETMLRQAAGRLARFGHRAEVRAFELESMGWLTAIEAPLRCVISSLCFHHLDSETKRRLFRDLAERLEPGGALLIADIVSPVSDLVRQSWAATWDDIAMQQSIQLTGTTKPYATFVEDGWNSHALSEPEPGEMPSQLFDQLKWLEEAGFSQVDCFWLRAGVAVYGGYR